jgi:glutathione S-transferase
MHVPDGMLTIASRTYGSWSLRAWLLCRLAGLDVGVRLLPAGDAGARQELLHIAPSFLVPRLDLEGIAIWDTLAIAEHLAEIRPAAGLLPADLAQRAHCRAISGEMHQGFADLRAALPMNLRARHPGFRVVSGAHADIERIVYIWRDCLLRSGGPFLFGERPMVADAMYAPVCTRFVTYDVALDAPCAEYRDTVLALEPMREWTAAAQEEADDIEELDIEF